MRWGGWLGGVVYGLSLIGATEAASLGDMVVHSRLGEPLRAEVEVFASAEELRSLAVRIADETIYRRAGLQPSPFLSQVEAKLTTRGGQVAVELRSSQPVYEPYLNVLLDLSWSGGRLVREYALLVDPPEAALPSPPVRPSTALPSPPVSAPAPVLPVGAVSLVGGQGGGQRSSSGTEGGNTASPKPIAEGANPSSAPPSQKEEEHQRAGGERVVRRGETLLSIAREVVPAHVPLEVVVYELWRTNPKAFVAGDINRLMAGARLQIPHPDVYQTVPVEEAIAYVRARVRPPSSLSTAVPPIAPAVVKGETPQVAEGRLQERGGVKGGKRGGDQVKVAPTEPRDGGKGKEGEKGVSAEDLRALQGGLEEAMARIAALEQQLQRLSALLELQAAMLAQLQPPAAPASSSSAPSGNAPLPKEQTGSPPNASAPTPEGEEGKEGRFLDFLREQTEVLLGGAALLLGVLLYLRWRRRSVATETPSEEEMKPRAPEGKEGEYSATGLAIAAAGGAVASSLASSSGGGSGQGGREEDAEEEEELEVLASSSEVEELDPLAEADLLIGYDRLDQAEEILQRLRGEEPDRPEVLVRLMEVAARRSDRTAFLALQEELAALTHREGPEWAKGVALAERFLPQKDEILDASPEVHGDSERGEIRQEAVSREEQAHIAPEEKEEELLLDFSLDLGSERGEERRSIGNGEGKGLTQEAESEVKEGVSKSEGLTTDVSKITAHSSAQGRAEELSSELEALLREETVELPAGRETEASPDEIDWAVELTSDSESGPEVAGPASQRSQEEDADTLSDSRLQLALAYLEMEDVEGARELIEEVMRDGTPKARAEAERLAARLPAA